MIHAWCALERLKRLNDCPPPNLPHRDLWHPLRAGTAIHEGEVFFGNIGSRERLDFTVIGPAVNEACRVETLQKKLGHDIVLTEAVARHIDGALFRLGEHPLKGVSAPRSLFCPDQ